MNCPFCKGENIKDEYTGTITKYRWYCVDCKKVFEKRDITRREQVDQQLFEMGMIDPPPKP